MYFRNVQNCEKTGICVTDVNLWWGVGRVETEHIGCLRSEFNSSAKGRDDTSSR